ncbi:flavodoxin-dependent (E)-4-hydroxy-3-methylbut-2-enyl-diphosphate synthase [Zhaonella formicivorans]|uniref:flavodoxin-dependent (E)-4-hydroxy-3-methylbut-2-enyl-diphosphate synthase n=1 Tax=Zhaonella formicivorans TaxID=2528593 RepID=UPI0010EDF4C1
MKRRISNTIHVGKVAIGGKAPISVQSMTNTDTRDVAATVQQIHRLEKAGCEIVRVAVVDSEAAAALKKIRERINIPLIADIHFDYRLALQAIESGVDGLRLNPGNIGSKEKVKLITTLAKERSVPIRIGVNAGSLDKRLLAKYGRLVPEALVESALEHITILEELQFNAIKVSLKASDIPLMVEAYRLLADKVPYPLHLGVTEAGTLKSGTVKSAVGIGILLAEGIGDTIRVSLTGDPVEEVAVGYEILKTLGLRKKGVELISCPTCGRCGIDLISIANEVEEKLAHIDKPLKIAVMGCVVNGPGEAREADVGIAGGKGVGILFKKGEMIAKVPQEQLVQALLAEVEKML